MAQKQYQRRNVAPKKKIPKEETQQEIYQMTTCTHPPKLQIKRQQKQKKLETPSSQ